MNFKKMSGRVLIAFGILASASGAMAQSSAVGTANATATIIRPISIVKDTDLAFGNVVPGASTGTIELTAAASTVATVSGGVTQPGTQRGTVTAAKFTVSGEGSFTHSITLPAAAVTISSGSNNMTVDTFTKDIVTGTLSGAAGTAGTQVFYVGGTLNVGINQAPGAYTGTFTVTVAYN